MNDMKIKTGRRAVQIGALFLALVSGAFAIFSFTGLLEGMRLTFIEGLGLTFASAFLLAEVLYEGARSGVRERDWNMMDILSGGLGVTTLLAGISALIGAFTGEVFFALPESVAGMVYTGLTLFLLFEIFSE